MDFHSSELQQAKLRTSYLKGLLTSGKEVSYDELQPGDLFVMSVVGYYKNGGDNGKVTEFRACRLCLKYKTDFFQTISSRQQLSELEAGIARLEHNKLVRVEETAEMRSLFPDLFRKFSVIRVGICGMQVCAHKDLSKVEIQLLANSASPTGIRSKWKVSTKPIYKPCECEAVPNHMHYILTC